MPVTTYTCEYDKCLWELKTDNMEHYVTLLKVQVDARHKQHATSAKAKKAKRLELASDVSDEDWSYFTSRWTQYKKATGLTGEDIITQLLECCNEQLRRDHHRTFSGATESNDEKVVLAQLKQIAVCKRNLAVSRVKLGTLKQDRGEPVRKFTGCVKSLASVSGYTIKCSKPDCNTDVSYQEAVVTDQLIRGLADSEIQKDILSHADSDPMDLESLLKYIEGKESGCASHNLLSGGGSAAVVQPGQGQAQGQGKCRWCGERHNKGKEHCKAAGQTCSACGKSGHFSKVCRSSNNQAKSAKTQSAASTKSSSDNFNDNCALFIRQPNKDFMYSGVFIGKEAEFKNSNKNYLKKLPARDCNTKEAKTTDKHRLKSVKKLPARDCKTRDGDNNKKERNDPLPASNYYNKTLESVLAVMVVSAISATTIASDVLHHHVFDLTPAHRAGNRDQPRRNPLSGSMSRWTRRLHRHWAAGS